MWASIGAVAALVAIVACKSYDALLTELSTDTMAYQESDGNFDFSVAESSAMGKRENSPGTLLHERLLQLPVLSMRSLDNAKALETIKVAAVKAQEQQNYGDFFYLWEVMHHNGYPAMLNDLGTGEFEYEIKNRLGLKTHFLQKLADTLTNTNLAEMYRNLSRASESQISKRDHTDCSHSNIPDKTHCDRLMRVLKNGLFLRRDRNRCHGSCCAAWNQALEVHTDWVRGKTEWCVHHCIRSGRSCKIIGISMQGKDTNLCVSSIATCT